MKEGAACHNNKVSNILKVGILLILGIILFIYSLFLATGNVGKIPAKVAEKSTNPKEIRYAKNLIKDLLDTDKYGFIKEYRDSKESLVIKIESSSWKKLAMGEKKKFMKKLAKARSALGLAPNIHVVDAESSFEYASFENNRVTLGELDF